MKRKSHNFTVLIERDEDGIFVGSVPSLKGCHTQGETIDELLKNIKEAIELCLEVSGCFLSFLRKQESRKLLK